MAKQRTRGKTVRTVEFDDDQLAQLQAVGHVTRRSVSFLVREACAAWLTAYKQAHPQPESIPVALSSIAEIGQPAFQIRPPPEDKK
jgi:hypothetical protein